MYIFNTWVRQPVRHPVRHLVTPSLKVSTLNFRALATCFFHGGGKLPKICSPVSMRGDKFRTNNLGTDPGSLDERQRECLVGLLPKSLKMVEIRPSAVFFTGHFWDFLYARQPGNTRTLSTHRHSFVPRVGQRDKCFVSSEKTKSGRPENDGFSISTSPAETGGDSNLFLRNVSTIMIHRRSYCIQFGECSPRDGLLHVIRVIAGENSEKEFPRSRLVRTDLSFSHGCSN